MIASTIGTQFRKARAQKGCSAYTMASIARVSHSDWLAFELGMKTRDRIAISNLEKCAKFLSLNIKACSLSNALKA